MSSLGYMKKDCFASGTLSSASLKGTWTKIQSKRHKKRRVALQVHREADNECDFCRCSALAVFERSHTVHRIWAACLLSFLALLGSVSVDLNSHLDLLRTTEDAYDQLTSCRTMAIVRLVGELQKMRSLWTDNVTVPEMSLAGVTVPAFSHLCRDLTANMTSRGLTCGPELAGFCEETGVDFKRSLNGKRDTDRIIKDNGNSLFSPAILRLLDIWGTVEEDMIKVKQYSSWRDVLSARLLIVFIELNHQLSDFPQTETQNDMQFKWTHTLSHLGFAMLMAERLHDCWLENMDLKFYHTNHRERVHILDSALWQMSRVATGSLSGSHTGIQALRNTHECLLARAVPALRMASRVEFSALSMRICLLTMACLIYPVVMVSFKQMTEWIQNYARSLKEKTEDLKRQRRLAEDLLHQMLPKSVAKQLRQQKHVEAESYEKVTIFFSDIVGFTTISASCTPLQVVEMLNNLYMCFDTRIDSYDVYKVETIGDAYMVVSGLPERNGEKHVDEIAKMSLDLVAAVRQVAIPHMPNQRLQLRVGIHTGPCVAGIVGYKMPRYCLFGDTVNTASRMESTSLPQRIHTSSATYEALIKDNAYELQLRGEIEVKGKGKMNTYWLIGHKNYSVQNDSLVCNWNPGMARKKKMAVGSKGSMGNSSVTVKSVSENTAAPISLTSSVSTHMLPQPRSDRPGLCVSAQVEPCASSSGGLGSVMRGPRRGDGSPVPAVEGARGNGGDKPDLLPGSIPHC